MTGTNPLHAASQTQPAAAYRERETQLQATATSLHREHIRLGYLRLAFGAAVLVLLFPPVPYLVLPLLAFGLAAHAHAKVLHQLAATRRALAFYDHALARVEDRWAGLRPRPTPAAAAASLYAADLDLFGPASLFELLCEARTSLGEDTLAAWLLQPTPPTQLRERHRAIADLRSHLQLRERFAAAPGPALASLDPPALITWAQTPPRPLPTALQWGAPLLILLTALAAWRYAATHSPLLLLGMLLADFSLTFAYRRHCKPLFAEAERAQRSLQTATTLLRDVEQQDFTAPRLRFIETSLKKENQTASSALDHLARLAQWADARGNYIVRILDAPLLYSLQLALALERWRARHGAQLGQWLNALGEAEALLSLAGYSFDHPDDPFPQFTEDLAARFTAAGLGHPLLSARTCVRNDVSLGSPHAQMLLVSGSNMSGKSTLLRSVGVNAVLAFAGAPVRATSLTLSPLTIAASIHVNDSLKAGKSRFYAEILRLRAITEAAHTSAPALFLLDELLAGTNSGDRLTGARGLVTELLETGAIGLLSTHDLTLITLTESNGLQVRNVHFDDQFIDGQLAFDYKLREGPVERSNGIALMRLIGLHV